MAETDFTDWTRVDFGDPYGAPAGRANAEKEVHNDVQKPIQQLMCDVHEQATSDRLSTDAKQMWITVRMVSMMGRVALEHERVGKELVRLTDDLVRLTDYLVKLTWWIKFLTIALCIIGVLTIIVGLIPVFHH